MKNYILFISLVSFLSFSVSSQKSIELTVLFPHDGFELSDTSMNTIDSLVNILSGKSVSKIELKGHTDNEGNHKYNVNLSQKRTESVKAYLIKKGLDSLLIVPSFFGEDLPVSSVKSKNRRVEINVLYHDVSIKDPPCEGTIRYVANQSFDFDVDGDKKMDFTMTYDMVGPTVQGNTSYSISGGMRAIKDYECMYCSDKSHNHLTQGDTIYLNQNDDCRWLGFKLAAVKFNKKEKRWYTLNNNETNIQYFATKIKQNGTVKLGWIKLKFDECTGKFELVATGSTTSDYIVIDQ